MTTPTSEVLNKAADLIERQGWGQGAETWAGAGDLCLEGAIGAALGRRVNQDMYSGELNFVCRAGRAVRSYLDMEMDEAEAQLAAQRRGGGYWLCHWNDQPGRTASEVIEVLRAAALIEAAKEDATVAESVTV